MHVLFRRIHLYLGLASGLLVLLVCFTGSVLVFEQELEHTWHAERYYVTPPATPALPLAQLLAAVRAARPKAKISGVKVYADPHRTVEVSLAGAPGSSPGGREGGPSAREEGRGGREEGRSGPRGGEAPGKGPGGKGGKGGKDAGPRLFVNPYTAAITGELNPRQNFFHTMEELHRGLVAGRTGKLVMGINAIVFTVILLSGLVLWWPATRKALKARLQVKWGSSWKRLNHDWHIVLGFYASLFLLIMALTGIGMAFEGTNKLLEAATGSALRRSEAPESVAAPGAVPSFVPDALLAQARQRAPQAAYYALQFPKEPSGSIRVATPAPGALTENAADEVYIDQYSGQIIRQQVYAERSLAQRVRALYKPIHTGAIGGWLTKTLALFVILFGFTAPITGTILWLNRTRKNRRKRPVLQAA